MIRKKPVPLAEREQWFIRQAAQIEKTTAKEIAEETRRAPSTISELIRKEGLRSPEMTRQIRIAALKSRHFPAHDKIPAIIELLKETKQKGNMSFQEIAERKGVSSTFVVDVARKRGILSEEEIQSIPRQFSGKLFKAHLTKERKKYRALYEKARQRIASTRMNFSKIAKKLGVSELFVRNANRGRGGDKPIRSDADIKKIAYNLKPVIKHFSDKQKLELIEGVGPRIEKKCRQWQIPQKQWQDIIDYVKARLFRKLDYVDPKTSIPIEKFVNYFSGFYFRNAVKAVRKKTIAAIPTDKRGQPAIAFSREKTPPEVAITKELIGKIENALAPQEKDVLLKRADGMTLRAIGKTQNLSREMVRQIEAKAKAKLGRYFKASKKMQ